MPERRGFRFALEVVFLAALAAALSLAELRPVIIAGLMLLGWVIVALLEWSAWRGQPHYGRGLPPRYYVPPTFLPPPVPVEQAWRGYPAAEQHEDALTWIAPRALRSELLDDWPVAALLAVEPLPEPVLVTASEPPVAAEPEPGFDAEAEPEFDAEPEPEPEPEAAVAAQPEPEPESLIEPEPEPHAPPISVAHLVAQSDPQLEVHPDSSIEAPERDDASVRATAPISVRIERHRIDPLGGQERGRFRWRRGGRDQAASAAVPARPEGVRPLPVAENAKIRE